MRAEKRMIGGINRYLARGGIALLDDTIVAVGGRLAAGYSAQVQGYQALFRAAIPQLK